MTAILRAIRTLYHRNPTNINSFYETGHKLLELLAFECKIKEYIINIGSTEEGDCNATLINPQNNSISLFTYPSEGNNPKICFNTHDQRVFLLQALSDFTNEEKCNEYLTSLKKLFAVGTHSPNSTLN